MCLALILGPAGCETLRSTWWDFGATASKSCIGSMPVMQIPLQAAQTPILQRAGTCPKKLKQGAKREGRRVGCRTPDICTAELQGPLGCLQIKGPLDSSHQTPSSRTPPFISSFIHPPKRGHYVDTLHDLFP